MVDVFCAVCVQLWLGISSHVDAALPGASSSCISAGSRVHAERAIGGRDRWAAGGWRADGCRHASMGTALRSSHSISIVASHRRVAFIGCMAVKDPVQATLFLALVGFATDLGIGAVWAYAQDVGGRHCGSVMGWANMWGNLGAAFSPLIMGAILQRFELNVELGWQIAFVSCALIQLLAVFASLGVTADKKID